MSATDVSLLVALGALVGVTLTLRIQLPRGGSIPMGHAVVIAVAFQLSFAPFVLVCASALTTALVVSGARGRNEWSGRDAVVAVLGMAAAGLAAVAVHRHLPVRGSDGWAQASLLGVMAIGSAHVTVDLALGRRSAAWSWRAAAPVYAALISSAALIAMATGWLLVFAALPLMITWYSFERYAAARRTYEQTIQALGIVPELAGHVAIGHGERTAAYARALAIAVELPPERREHVVIAARLHHVGHVAVPDCEETRPSIEDSLVATASAKILRVSGFLPEIADLVEALAAPDADDAILAILRVASAFDDLVGEAPDRARGALAILDGRAEGRAWSRVVDTLRSLVETDAAFVESAIAEGAPLTAAAAAAHTARATVAAGATA
ncbi:MAG TPA: HD domain-containing protein [Acidimicrobiales bacterium]|jgi:hypothetical protein|nr:HD domain-containing protein [Acidimicrobiales bacterium]